MPRERFTIRALGIAALIVAALGLGMVLGVPDMAVAQEDTTTTVVEDDSTDTTVDESTEESEEAERPARGDHDCGDRSDEKSSDDSSSSDA
jgi:hypothetical protein